MVEDKENEAQVAGYKLRQMFNKERCFDLFKHTKLDGKNGKKFPIYEAVSEERFVGRKLHRNHLGYMHQKMKLISGFKCFHN
jgi:hypothetical protein